MFCGNDFAAYGVILAVQFVFAIYQLLAKIVFERYGVDPLAFAFLRMTGATTVLIVNAAIFVPRDQLWPRPGDRWRFLLMAMCMFGNIVSLVYALKFTTSAMVAMLQVLRPIFAGLLSWSLGIEKPTAKKLMGLAVCVVGGIAVTHFAGSEHSNAGDHPVLGACFVCIHSFSIAAYVIQQPCLVDRGYSAFAVNAQSYAIACILTAVVLKLPGTAAFHDGVWFDTSPLFILLVLHGVLFVSVWSYLAMAWAAKRLGGTVVMLFMLLQAVLILGAGRCILGEKISAGQAGGGVLIVCGLLTFALDATCPDEHVEDGMDTEATRLLQGKRSK